MSLNIITLPSNIGGISVPDAVKGPLTALYGPGQYDKATLRYPRDLGTNPARKHSIVFTVKKIDPAQVTAVASDLGNAAINTGKEIISSGGDVLNEVSDGVLSAVKNAVDGNFQGAGNALAAGTSGALGKAAIIGEKLQPGINALSKALIKPNRIPILNIGLYIPENVKVSYATGYDDDESLSSNLGRFYFLAQGATSLARAFKDQGDKTLTNMINAAGNDPYVRDAVLRTVGRATGTNLTRLGLNAAGYAMNPQLQVLFRGIGFREFQFDFVFTPYNKQESDTVKQIIEKFKYHAAPKISPNGAFDQGFFMEIPETFDISFYYGNQENRNVNRIGECVLTNVDVNYSAGGWSTHNDGTPSQITMTLNFKETIIIDKNRIDQGY